MKRLLERRLSILFSFNFTCVYRLLGEKPEKYLNNITNQSYELSDPRLQTKCPRRSYISLRQQFASIRQNKENQGYQQFV